jgi:hypothetical protein
MRHRNTETQRKEHGAFILIDFVLFSVPLCLCVAFSLS